MFRFLISKIALVVPTFIGITIVAFAFVRVLPGDPVLLLAGERGMDPERYQQLLVQFGYDRPIWEQYFSYLLGLFQGWNYPSSPSLLPPSSASRPASSPPCGAARPLISSPWALR